MPDHGLAVPMQAGGLGTASSHDDKALKVVGPSGACVTQECPVELNAGYPPYFVPDSGLNPTKIVVAFGLGLCIVAALQCILVVKFGSPSSHFGSNLPQFSLPRKNCKLSQFNQIEEFP